MKLQLGVCSYKAILPCYNIGTNLLVNVINVFELSMHACKTPENEDEERPDKIT